MVQRIYTKTGDKGQTGLFGGGRVSKAHARVVAYGDVDELNACLGWVLTRAATDALTERLLRLQSDLFAIGAHLATPEKAQSKVKLPELPVGRIAEMEKWIDDAEDRLPKLDAFILPGGTTAAASLHVARTLCRRAERSVVALAETEFVDPNILVFLNRLSDLLFVLARIDNARAGMPERKWQP